MIVSLTDAFLLGISLDKPINFFDLIFPPAFFEPIVQFTNLKGAELFRDNWEDTNIMEIRAFLALLITAGFCKQNLTYDRILWNERLGPLVYRATMSITRFRQLRQSLRFDDPTTRAARRLNSKLAPIESLWQQFEQRLGLIIFCR